MTSSVRFDIFSNLYISSMSSVNIYLTVIFIEFSDQRVRNNFNEAKLLHLIQSNRSYGHEKKFCERSERKDLFRIVDLYRKASMDGSL